MAHLYKHKVKFLPVFLVVVLMFGVILSNVSLAAGTITTLSDTVTDNTKNAFINHVILFRLSSTGTLIVAGDKIIMTFPSDFDFTNAAIGDVAFDHGPTTSVTTPEPLLSAATADNWGAAFSGGATKRILTLTAPTDGTGGGAVANSDYVRITLTSTGGDEFKNASTAQSYTVTLSTQTSGSVVIDSGSFAIPIIDDGSVDVTATVDPSITFAIDDTTCSLTPSPLTSGGVSTCTYNITTTTNATSGIVIKSSAPYATLRSAAYGGGNTDEINACSGTSCDGAGTTGVNTGQEEYGFYVSTVGHTAAGLYGTNSQAVPTSSTTILSTTGPHNSTVSTITHGASITAITPAGSYSQTITWTAVGNF